jgi:hypothetical protein
MTLEQTPDVRWTAYLCVLDRSRALHATLTASLTCLPNGRPDAYQNTNATHTGVVRTG